MEGNLEIIRGNIEAKGDLIRKLKSEGTDKAGLAPHIAELTALKQSFMEANNGVPYDPPKVNKEKKEKQPDTNAEQPGKNKEKKDARKQEKKEKRANAKASNQAASQEEKVVSAPVAEPPKSTKKQASKEAAKPTTTDAPKKTKKQSKSCPEAPKDQVFFSKEGGLPVLAWTVAQLCVSPVNFAETTGGGNNLPSISVAKDVAIFGDFAIARYLSRISQKEKPLIPSDAASSAAMEQWLDLLQSATYSPPQLAELMEPYLESRTYLAGYALSLADLAVCLYLGPGHYPEPAVSRWKQLVMSEASVLCVAEKNLLNTCGAKTSSGPGDTVPDEETIAQCPPLEGAEEGKVCTRFPPEPSGYLHIGHAKAVLLNSYYATHYKGKLIVRFDDTNPSKEKDEFVQNILKDLADLGVKPDIMSHTSDHFDLIYDMAKKMIREGKAFMDDTPQEQMREERMQMKNSANRDMNVEESLKIFESMCAGKEEAAKYCLRAKIDMQSPNGTMRDPVLFRQNLQPHLRTGTKYKAYPTYDLACPIVDSIEGVTHALRTTEYNDRDEQYYWIQEALGLRKVLIHSFARLNFVQTVLSKRKLTWFVETGKVDGWNDPRFPTIQGVLRRGFCLDALRDFILSQGASRRIVNMQWDQFWAMNKKYFEPTASRFMAVFRDSAVPLFITNGPDGLTGKSVPLHPQHPEYGDRVIRLAKKVLVEGDDANQIVEGEQIVLMRWGVIKISKVQKENDQVVGLEGAYDPDGDLKKAKKKLTWLADCEDLLPVKLVEFDYLITKETIEEDDKFEDFVNPCTRAETDALGDPGLRHLKEGEVIQLERRGFFRCDRPYLGPQKPLMLFMIPDGKTKAMSSLSSALKHR